MPPRHESFFQYSLTRPYPFRWFTWIAVIGFICASVLFTLLNIGTNGYDLKPFYTTNPNGTDGTAWFQKPPVSWLSNLETSCQSQSLMLGSTYMTTNMAFSYTLISLSQPDENDNIIKLQGTPYLNNTLQNCTVDKVYIFPLRRDTSVKSPYHWSWSNTYTEAKVSCLIPGPPPHPASPVTASFQVQYRWTPGVTKDFLRLDNRTDSSQWWGFQSLTRTWGSLAIHMGTEFINETDNHPAMGYDCGDFSFFRNSSSAPEFSSRDFFFGIGKFFAADANIHMVVNEHSWEPIPLSQMNNTGLASALDGFAKAFYSFVLLDLGNPSELTHGDSITYLLSQRNDTILGVEPTKALETFQDKMGPLKSTPAQLSLQYVCSVPQKKEIFSLVVSVIIGNIVLLSAFWSALNWMASTCVSSQDRNWNHCVGCQCNAESCRFETPPKVDEESVQLVMEKTE